MVGSRVYLNIILTLLVATVVFFGISLTRAYDRMFFELKSAPHANQVVAALSSNNSIDQVPPRANVEFFVPNAPSGGRLTRAVSAETQNLNLLITNEATVAMYNNLCNSSLATRNYQTPSVWQPLLAESWTISPDHKEYRIKLLKGVLWQNVTDPVTGKIWLNQEVTAHDFKFFVDVVKNPLSNCAPLRVYYQDLEDIEIINNYEFVVRWTKPYYGSLPATLGMSPFPRHFYDYGGEFDAQKFNLDHVRNRMIVGCGPYKLSSWEKGKRVVLEADQNYFGQRYGLRPPLKYLVFELIRHPNTQMQSLLAGTLDRLQLTGEQWQHADQKPQFTDGTLRKFRYLSQSYSYIGYNLNNPLFADKKVRQALTMLINREKIKNIVYFDQAEVTTGPFSPDSVYYDQKIRPWPFDLELAKRQLRESGWQPGKDGILTKDGVRFSFMMLQIASHPTQEKILPLIKEDMAAAGIEMKIQTIEWSVYIQRLEEKNFDACMLGWTSPLDPDPYQVWHSAEADKRGSSNHISFKNTEADRLIEQLRASFDMPERTQIAHDFHRLLHDEQPYTFLLVPYALLAQSSRYENVRVFDSGIADEVMFVPESLQKAVPGF